MLNIKSDCFRAAVYEHIPHGNISLDSPQKIIDMNLKVFEEITKKAAKSKANIIVFPEDGIIFPYGSNRSKVSQFIEQIPDPSIGVVHNPCNQKIKYESKPILYRLSCMAKDNNIYVVANMGDFVKCDNTSDEKCPKDGHYQFNTAVAFDSGGNLVAKYHKMQLFHEPYNDVPPKPEFIYFDTPFGRMGLHICADMRYKLPGTQLVTDYNVTTMIQPSNWFYDELPLAASTQLQESWAITNRVNHLVSNLQNPPFGSIGSGIYSGSNGAKVYTHRADGKSKLLMADIPIDSRNTKAKCYDNPKSTISEIELLDSIEFKTYKYVSIDTEGFILWKLTNKKDIINSCVNGVCCKINYSVINENSLKEDSYYFMVGNRTGPSTEYYPKCEEVCFLVLCDNFSNNTCESFATLANRTIFNYIDISGKFSTIYSYPSVISNDVQLVPKHKWNYINDYIIGQKVQLQVNNLKEQIISAGFYARCFDRDPPFRP